MEKKCIKCDVELTDSTKVTNENICKSCNKIRQTEWRERKKQGLPLIKKVHTNCSLCDTELTDDNRLNNRTYCKDCRSKKYQDQVKELIVKNDPTVNEILCGKCSIKLTPENQVKGRKCCKPCDNQRRNESKKLHKEETHKQQKVYYEKNKEKIKEYYKEHYVKNKDKYLENNQKWRKDHKDENNEKERIRRSLDENHRIKKNLRRRLYNCIKKDRPTMEYIGCDLDFLKKWLSYRFTDEMTFQNYGPYWHIDHVIPCSKFDLENEDEIKNCFVWYNLQPLEGNLNLSKNNNMNEQEFNNHYKKLKQFATENNIDIDLKKYKKYFNELR